MRATLGLALVLAAAAGSVPAAEKAPPNIVLIISDDHGWTDYGFLGHPHVQTPRLDRLAAQSLTFPRGYVPSSLCCPSLASIITGRYPHQHKITCNDPPAVPGLAGAKYQASKEFLDGREAMNRHLDAVPTLPRLLATKGYLSLQTGKWWQGDYRRGGFTHGMTKGQRHGDAGLEIGRKTMQPVADFITLARREKKPFFVWYAPMLPHQPHDPPERFLARTRGLTPSLPVAKYWAMVEWFDETCGQLLDELDRQGVADNTLVAYVTDNGWIQDPEANKPVRSKTTPYDAGLRTPILLRWPGHVKPEKCAVPVQSIDLAPTLLTAAGVTPPKDLPGVNLLDRPAVQARTAVFGECFTHNAIDLNVPARNLRHRWIVEGKWKLIVPHVPEAGTTPQLYDILADPAEAKDRASAHPDVVERLRGRLDQWWTP